MNNWKKFIMVEVPKESKDWNIDDVLGNCLQYTIDGVWRYDTKVDLPFGELKVIGTLNKVIKENLKLNIDKNWLLIKCKR